MKDFEQAKREFAEKWGYLTFDYVETNCSNECLSDLTALLEQHKEMMLGFAEWIGEYYRSGRIYYAAIDEKWGLYPFEHDGLTTIELFNYWLKNVKK